MVDRGLSSSWECIRIRRVCGPQALPQYLDVPLIRVPNLLGISRCTQLQVTCRDWAVACSADVFGPPVGFEEVLSGCPGENVWARRIACVAMLHVLGAPDFGPRPEAIAEDDVHWLLTQDWTKELASKMLQSSFSISGPAALAKLTAALRPRCKLPSVVLGVIFHPRSQVHVALQPVHCAVLLSAPTLLRKLLSVAKHSGTLSDYTVAGLHHTTVSPLLLAAFFSDQEVVDVLKEYGVCLNRVDAIATRRLQIAFLWADLESRLIALQLGAEAEELAKMMDELRQEAGAIMFHHAAIHVQMPQQHGI